MKVIRLLGRALSGLMQGLSGFWLSLRLGFLEWSIAVKVASRCRYRFGGFVLLLEGGFKLLIK